MRDGWRGNVPPRGTVVAERHVIMSGKGLVTERNSIKMRGRQVETDCRNVDV